MTLQDRIIAQLKNPYALTDVTIDEAYSYVSAEGYHVLRVVGYDPNEGGKPAYQVTLVSGDGKNVVLGDGADTLRGAVLRAALVVMKP